MDTDSAFTHHKQYLELENAKFSDYLGLLDESIVGYGNEKEEGKLIQYVSDEKGNIKEERETVKEKGNIIGKGVGQFHDDIKEVDEGKIIQQLNDAPKFRIDKIIGISKETPILELLEKTLREHSPASSTTRRNEYEKGVKKITNTIQDFCKECVVVYHKVNKSISPEGSEQLTLDVFENMLKQDETGKRKQFTVKDERIFKKSFKDGKCAGITTVYRDKDVNKNGGWQGRELDYENNRWIPWSQ